MKDDQLDAWLAQLTDADLEVEPPPALEARTLAAWDQWRRENDAPLSRRPGSHSQRRAPAWMVAALAGLAAALLAGLAIPRVTSDAGSVRRGPDRESQIVAGSGDRGVNVASGSGPSETVGASPAPGPGEPPRRALKAEGPVVNEGIRPASPGIGGQRDRRQPRLDRGEPKQLAARHRANQVAAPMAVETASFVPLGPDVERELTGTFELARVRVSRDVLVDLGLLMDGPRGGGPVQADVVFSEDGLARAIRLAPVSRRMP